MTFILVVGYYYLFEDEYLQGLVFSEYGELKNHTLKTLSSGRYEPLEYYTLNKLLNDFKDNNIHFLNDSTFKIFSNESRFIENFTNTPHFKDGLSKKYYNKILKFQANNNLKFQYHYLNNGLYHIISNNVSIPD